MQGEANLFESNSSERKETARVTFISHTIAEEKGAQRYLKGIFDYSHPFYSNESRRV